MSERILVGVAAAPIAVRVVEWAGARAAATRAEVELVTVVGGAVGAVGEDAIVARAHANAQELVDTHAAHLREAGITVTARVARGNPVAVLTEASTQASLLVIGSDYQGPGSGRTHGVRGIRISAAAHCPVVIVPDVDVSGRSGVLVGTDGSPVSEHAVAFAAAEADRLGETLTALSVWTPMPIPGPVSGYPEPYLADMKDVTAEILGVAVAGLRADYPGLQIEQRVEAGYPSAVINELAQDARLAVVGSHGRGAFARLMLGSISHEVLMRLATVTAVVR